MLKEIHKQINLKIVFALLALFFIANESFAQQYKVRMAFIGNSITYGSRLDNPATECYPAQLNDMLTAVYGDTVEILNAGVSGRTLTKNSGNSIWGETVFSQALKFAPDICVILLGTNDCHPVYWDVSGQEFLADYLSMIDTFKVRHPETQFLVCYPPPVFTANEFGHDSTTFVDQVLPRIDTVLQQRDAIAIDFFTAFKDKIELFHDFLHPNIDGAQIMAEMLYDTIMARDLIRQVDTSLAYIEDFMQSKSPVAPGSMVELEWITHNAVSVELDGETVELNGSKEVLADVGKVYTLTVNGTNNTLEFPLTISTYVPVKTSLLISTSSNDYKQGHEVFLYTVYRDQFRRVMTQNTENIQWSILEGEAEFGDQTDTSIVFIPTKINKVVVEARDGDISIKKTLYVNELSSAIRSVLTDHVSIFPNPVKEMLQLRVKNYAHSTASLRIYSLAGEQILVKDFASDPSKSVYKVNTSALESGVYLFEVKLDSESISGQFIKTNE